MAKEFHIEDKLGYFDGGNNSNNNTANNFDRRIREEGGVRFDVKERRLRCFGHYFFIFFFFQYRD